MEKENLSLEERDKFFNNLNVGTVFFEICNKNCSNHLLENDKCIIKCITKCKKSIAFMKEIISRIN